MKNKEKGDKATLWEWCFFLQAIIFLIGVIVERCHDYYYYKEREENIVSLEEDSLNYTSSVNLDSNL